MIDLSKCKIDPFRAYNGANGNKICVFYKNERYMVKFTALTKDNKALHYSNGCINEYIASKIYQSIQIPTQETFLATYNSKGKEKMVVACKDFCENGDKLLSFGEVKNACIDSSNNGFGTELTEILDTIEEQKLVGPYIVKERFWKMFVADAFLGNFDRHNGNWGFIVNQEKGIAKLCPVFDNGSCLYPQLTDEQMAYILTNEAEIDNRLYVFPNSSIKENGKKINYFDFLSTTTNQDCIKALQHIKEKIDMENIQKIIYSCDELSATKKDFYAIMLRKRKEKIIDKCFYLQCEKNVSFIDQLLNNAKEQADTISSMNNFANSYTDFEL